MNLSQNAIGVKQDAVRMRTASCSKLELIAPPNVEECEPNQHSGNQTAEQVIVVDLGEHVLP